MSARSEHRGGAGAWRETATGVYGAASPPRVVTTGAMRMAPTTREAKFQERGFKRGLARGFVLGLGVGGPIGFIAALVTVALHRVFAS